jgi:hypothetical protein
MASWRPAARAPASTPPPGGPLFPTLLALFACEPWGRGLPQEPVDPLGQEALVVSPSELDFGSISVREDGFATASFTITNGGTETLTVHGHDEVVGDADAFAVAADPYMELRPGHSQELLVRFLPATEATYRGELRINYGVETLSLVGGGLAPVLVLDRPEVPPTAVGCTASVDLSLRNAGSEVLHLDGLSLADETEYRVVGAAPAALSPGEAATVTLGFSPMSGGWRSTSVAVWSDDPLWPDEAPATVVLEGLGVAGATASERFLYAPDTQVDVLFAVDSSGIMAALLDRADPALLAWEEQLGLGAVDLHSAVLTGASTCPATSPAWLDGSESSEERVALLQEGFDGAAGAWSDELLALAATALRTETGPGGCLEGFLREGARLQIVVVTGQADQGALDPAATLLALQEVAPANSSVVVSALMATTAEGCNGTTYGEGYAEVVLASGGRIADLCAASWSEGFADFAEECVLSGSGALSHPLGAEPLPESLRVTADGAPATGWSYDAASNAVVFDAASGPAVGAEIEVQYMLAQACE